MVSRDFTIRGKALVAAVLIAVTLSGCAETQSWLESIRDGRWLAGKGSGTDVPPTAEEYLTDLSRLSSSDPVLQAEVVADAKAAAEQMPNPSTTLQYALALATPGHPDSDSHRAQSMQRELMARPARLTPTETALAAIYLKSTEETLVLSTEVSRLRASSDRVQRTREAAMTERLATVEAENRQLRRDLDEAESKLEAITSIERSIRQQDQ